MRVLAAAIGLLGVSDPILAQEVCTRDADPCDVPMGTYRVALPEVQANPTPAILFLHGAGGTGQGVLGMSQMVADVTARGYAVIAPDGLPWRPGRRGGIWSFLPADQREPARDEAEFFDELLADASDRYGIDPDRVLLAGFSAGGFMVTYLACSKPEAFPAYAPVAGGFWRPHPEDCAGPVKLLHTHGFADSTVPLEGRPLGGGRYLQGDIFEGLALLRAANGCAAPDPDQYRTSGIYMRRVWTCTPGSALEFALWQGGHAVPEGWADMTIDWFEAVTGGDG